MMSGDLDMLLSSSCDDENEVGHAEEKCTNLE